MDGWRRACELSQQRAAVSRSRRRPVSGESILAAALVALSGVTVYLVESAPW